MAALDQDALFVCFLSSDPPGLQQYERDLLDEIRAKDPFVKCRVVVLVKRGGEAGNGSAR